MIRGLVRAGLLGVMFCGGALAAAPEPLLPLRDILTDIKPQRLADALTAWAQLTGYQLVVPFSKAAERPSPRVHGNMTAQESLDRLLAGSGLIFERINARTIAIREDYSAPLPIEPKIEQKPLLASVERIEVTGSRLRGDIRADGSLDTSAPVVTFDRERLDQSGASSASELLKLIIPQQPYGPAAEHALGNQGQFAEVRGLGRDATLVLINGRRTIPSSNSVVFNAFDLNSLPLAAVERVEVLSDSASAVYGSDAVGGVINFIMKRDIPQPVIDFNYGAASGGADERRVSFSSGYSNERLNAALVVDYFDRATLLGSKRDRWNNQDYTKFGGRDWRTFNANPGNITSLSATNLPGLPSRFAAVPMSSTGIGLTPEDFLATAGQRNTESLFRFRSVVPEAQRRSVAAFADLGITSTVKAFGEFLYLNDRSTEYVEPEARTLAVPADHPFNPFDTAVSVDYLFRGLARTNHTESRRYRAVAGLRGGRGDWDWELSALRIDDEGSSSSKNRIAAAKVSAALAATDPTEALNVFSDGPGGSPTLLASLVAEPNVRPYHSKATQGAGVLRGRLFTLPAGDVDMVLGGEWLKSDMFHQGPTYVVAHGRSVTAGFTELRVPLVAAAMGVPVVQKLSLTVAARHDRYSDFGSTFNPQYGLFWRPTADLAVRTSYGTSFRAPSLFELHLPRALVVVPVPDPLRNSEITTVTLQGGGNPDLKPIEANSLTAGFEFTPGRLKGLQISANYWRIVMDQRVSVVPYLAMVSNWEHFPDRVVRAERMPEDIAAGLPGRLTYVDLTRMNFGTLTTDGVDVSVSHRWETPIGDLSPSLSATWIDEYRVHDVPGALATNRVAIANQGGTVARWRGVATLEWNRDKMSLSATARYTAAYRDFDPMDESTTDRVIPSQTLIDVQGSLDFDQRLGHGSSWLPALKLTAGVTNLFDREPDFSEVGTIFGYDFTQGDLRGRFGYLRLSAQF